MNKLILPALLLLCFFTTCTKVEKDVRNYYPKVRTTSATVRPDGSVEVFGEIVSSGSTGIVNCGICMDTVPNPDMISNQTQASVLNGNTFSCVYSSLSSTTKYYFRAWCVNDNGYAIGDAVTVSGVVFDTASIPCHPASQVLSLTGNSTIPDISEIYSHTDIMETYEYEIWLYTAAHSLHLEFAGNPISGIYTTTGSNPGTHTVKLSVDNLTADSGYKVYVQQIDATHTDVTVCDASVYAKVGWLGDTYRFTMTTKFRYGF